MHQSLGHFLVMTVAGMRVGRGGKEHHDDETE